VTKSPVEVEGEECHPTEHGKSREVEEVADGSAQRPRDSRIDLKFKIMT